MNTARWALAGVLAGFTVGGVWAVAQLPFIHTEWRDLLMFVAVWRIMECELRLIKLERP